MLKFLLFHERSSIAGAPQMRRNINKLVNKAKNVFHGDTPVADDPTFKAKVAQFMLDLDALEMTELRGLAAQREGKSPGPESSLLKIKGTELQQRITSLAVESGRALKQCLMEVLMGLQILKWQQKNQHNKALQNINFRKVTIYGGTNEIQKNIIAKAVLGI